MLFERLNQKIFSVAPVFGLFFIFHFVPKSAKFCLVDLLKLLNNVV